MKFPKGLGGIGFRHPVAVEHFYDVDFRTFNASIYQSRNECLIGHVPRHCDPLGGRQESFDQFQEFR
jgi:hypothetical protein